MCSTMIKCQSRYKTVKLIFRLAPYILKQGYYNFSIITRMSSTFNGYRKHLSVLRLNIEETMSLNKNNKIILSRKNLESNVIFN